jgi:hypothetical protein
VADRGVLVFAFNSHTVDYVSIADQTSALISKNLALPITLVTDQHGVPTFSYDQVIRVSDVDGSNFRTDLSGHTVEWKNFGRYLAYDLSPYQETILLDTDYLVLSDSLLKYFDTDFDYKLMHNNSTVSGPSYQLMGETSLEFVWATVILFRKTLKSQLLFELVGKIQRNYNYYRALYNVREGNFRNDYAFAMASNMLSGYCRDHGVSIPGSMFTIDAKVHDITRTGDLFKIQLDKANTIITPNIDIHVMDKEYLSSANFQRLVGELCAA